ncbi:MAG: ATPase domain-containing protein [Candidatus Woesearchaeota archaeon]
MVFYSKSENEKTDNKAESKTDAEFRKSHTYVEHPEHASKLGSVHHKHHDEPGVRVPTGIPGFDELIEGGIKLHNTILIEGGAGTGKSIFAVQFLYNGIEQFNENGVYISFEEEREDFYSNMRRFGWDLEKLEQEKKFLFLRYFPEQVEKVLASGGGIIHDAIDAIKAKRLVIDSITAFTLLHNDELTKRESLLTLFRLIKKWGCTALVIGQPEITDPNSQPFNLLEFECDGVIRLYHHLEHNIRQRTIEVYKMRGTKHAEKTFSLEITAKGIVVYPENSNI